MKAILTIGISGSGKSYFASQLSNITRIERDLMRQQILQETTPEFNPESSNMWRYWNFKTGEKEVTKRINKLIDECSKNKQDIIVSDTNLSKRTRNNLIKYLEDRNYQVELKYFPVDYSLAVKRDRTRQHSVGESVLKSQWLNWLQQPRDIIGIPLYQKDINKPRAIMVDIDGTVARMTGRDPYDWKRVGEDEPIMEVIDLVNRYVDTHKIIFVSGRDSVCREDTFRWLSCYVEDFILYMRPQGSSERDDKIKAELFWKNVAEYYCVDFVIDDRHMVCRLWEDMGIKLLNVGSYYLEF
jgi:predicted kinase